MSDNTAILDGYTKEVIAYSDRGDEFHLFVKPDVDLDDCFKAYDADNCEFVRMNGWMLTYDFIGEW